MAWIASFLAALAPMLKDLFFKILVALGVTFISYQGFDLIMQNILSYIKANYFSLSPDVINFLNLAGVGEALNVVFGSFNFCVGLLVTGKAFKFMGGGK